MGVKVGLIFLFMLGAGWAIDARELVATNLFTRETDISNVSDLRINLQESEREIQASEGVGQNEKVCVLCEEFATKALNYLSQNKTQTEIMFILHKSCSKLLSFKQECITLVDYYAPLFFLEISSIQPDNFCQKVDLCEQVVFISQRLSKESCEFCHHAVDEAISKLKDPDTQLEIIELLLKGCDAVENYIKKCKRMVFEYGPLILANAEQLLEKTDICTMLHACDASTASTMQTIPMGKTFMLSKY